MGHAQRGLRWCPHCPLRRQ
ncbi:hypothetical protein HUT18_21085 [Streptomyces sp. NA04227]|nr:hypothetical protein HUT18_21085 [Streptomyces sp. NA04227]